MKNIAPLLFILLVFYGCSSDSTDNEDQIIALNPFEATLYFPPNSGNEWETTSIEALEWNTEAEAVLYTFLEDNNTDAFIILKNGRIVIERYFGDFQQGDNHAWNSAGKNLTAMTIGIAQSEGFLDINDTSATYLGDSWSSLTQEQEAQISIRNHLTMTTGLDYTVEDIFCTDPECLLYLNEPSTQWFYHNGPYTLLDRIITNAVGEDFTNYFNDKLKNRIGMQGAWLEIGANNVYFSNARSMARFGILNLAEGEWDGEAVLDDTSFFTAMTSPSQNLNPAYGYLYWLNGKSSFSIPGETTSFDGKLIPNAPDDLFAGLGRNDQKLYVVPSEDLVIVRFGDAANDTLLGPSSFDNDLWELLNNLME